MMKKKILIMTFITLTLSGCNQNYTELERTDNGEYIVNDTFSEDGNSKVYSDEEVRLQKMGNHRDNTEGYNKAVEMNIIKDDVIPRHIINREDFLKGFEVLKTVYIDVDTSELTVSNNIKIRDFINIIAQLVNSFIPYDSTVVFDNATFIETFEPMGNKLQNEDKQLIEKMSFLRSVDALPINEDDVMILDNNLTYEIYANCLVRIADLRVEQLMSIYYPEECNTCGTPIDKFYTTIEQLSDNTEQIIVLKLYNNKPLNNKITANVTEENNEGSGEVFDKEGLNTDE